MTHWTKSEIAFLKEHHTSLSYTELAARLNRSYASVRGKAQALQLPGISKDWTKDEIDFLKEYCLILDFLDRVGRFRMKEKFKVVRFFLILLLSKNMKVQHH